MYTQVKPHPALAGFIDAFWKVEGAGKCSDKGLILPDGCVDLIFNLGADYRTDNGTLTMRSEETYLVGTMTTFKETFLNASHKLVGIRFKPAAFSSFYNYVSLHEITDKTIAFEKSLSPDIHQMAKDPITYLNAYFFNRLNNTKQNLPAVIKDIKASKGQITIDTLAKENNTTVRQLERSFKKHIGISPKVFANIIRFRAALLKIKNNTKQESLFDIAVDCGYYDHAHFSNEIRRYSGITPSQF